MSEENRTPTTRQLAEVGDVHHSGESASEREDNLQSQLLDCRLSSIEVNKKINAIVGPLATQLKTLTSQWGNLATEFRIARLKGTQHLNDRDCRVNVPTVVVFHFASLAMPSNFKRSNLFMKSFELFSFTMGSEF